MPTMGQGRRQSILRLSFLCIGTYLQPWNIWQYHLETWLTPMSAPDFALDLDAEKCCNIKKG